MKRLDLHGNVVARFAPHHENVLIVVAVVLRWHRLNCCSVPRERERVNEDTGRRESLVLWIDDDDTFLAHREMRGAVIRVRTRRDIVEWDRQGLAGIHEQGA